MALEITEMSYEQGGPKKPAPQDKGTPKKPSAPQKGKLLSSMKKKYTKEVDTIEVDGNSYPLSRGVKKPKFSLEPELPLETSKPYGPVKAAIGPRLDRSPKETRKAKPGYIKE